jgi:hypothetical protein
MPLKKIKRAFKGARKTVKKLIPKEVRAIAPYVAAYYGGPAFAKSNLFSGIGSEALRAALAKGIIAGGTQFATDDEADFKDVARAGVLAATPDLISSGTGKFIDTPERLAAIKANQAAPAMTKTQQALQAVRGAVEGAGPLTTIGTQSAIEGVERLKEIEQDELDRYNRELQDRGIRSRAERRTAIRNIYLGIGYDEDYVDGMLDRFGYKEGGGVMALRMSATKDLAKKIEEARKKKEKKADGGRIGLKRGGIGSLIAELMQSGMSYDEAAEAAEDYYDELEAPEKIREGAKFAEEGFKSAFGVDSLFPTAPKPMGITPGFGNLPRMADGGDVMSPEEYFKEKGKFKKRKDIDDMMREYEEYLYKQKYGPRDSAAEGGLMNLGGNEMDLRGGGFVPIGKKEKADDVPARLSKNEFVMTADAVRGAGGGDVNEGARRMYQTMDKLEAMA